MIARPEILFFVAYQTIRKVRKTVPVWETFQFKRWLQLFLSFISLNKQKVLPQQTKVTKYKYEELVTNK